VHPAQARGHVCSLALALSGISSSLPLLRFDDGDSRSEMPVVAAISEAESEPWSGTPRSADTSPLGF
jgi:hypothetical protein